MAADSSSSSSNSSNNTREEPIFVLYGSQTGNSEQAAKDFCTELETKFTPSFFEGLGLEPVAVETTCIQLDDFLEYRHAAFTRTMVIFVSSYGVGQAPIGSYKFRSFAEELIKMAETNNGSGSGSSAAQLLGGLSYALCGLGESSCRIWAVTAPSIVAVVVVFVLLARVLASVGRPGAVANNTAGVCFWFPSEMLALRRLRPA